MGSKIIFIVLVLEKNKTKYSFRNKTNEFLF